jgi:phosphatidylglycerophosphate synthase
LYKPLNVTGFGGQEALPPEFRRRPIRARGTRWAAAAARALQRAGFRPNQISVLSVVFAAVGACALGAAGWSVHRWPDAVFFLLAALCVQLRLLCNLFDGLVAVEGGLSTRSGEIYNELPDRISDALLLVAAGYAAAGNGWSTVPGWAAALLAMLVAYVRTLGGQAGATQQFCGPMAKPQRMFTLTLGCLASAVEVLVHWPMRAMFCALVCIVLGCIITAVRRTMRIVRELELAGTPPADP